MIKSLSVMATLLFATPVLAQTGSFTTTNDVVNQMIVSWGEYDAACRGTSPSQGADGFCGARDYITWVLSENNICLSDDPQSGDVWQTCGPDSYVPEDPIAEIRQDF